MRRKKTTQCLARSPPLAFPRAATHSQKTAPLFTRKAAAQRQLCASSCDDRITSFKLSVASTVQDQDQAASQSAASGKRAVHGAVHVERC